ncbi:MAG: glycerol-3-phosphate dehydrogenase [Candidatus Melainabacteria bacterium HGW-Melainabacteria-1]|nr:MAG: glycerol-3-phosphate dehydrogenase [Candidatus Melainabacteria bacterium HGW-Melainabacteria-1]
MNVGVIGGGSWGTTIVYLLSRNPGNRIKLWVRNPEVVEEINSTRRNLKYSGDADLTDRVEASTDLEYVIRQCPLLFLVVTSASARDVLHEMGNYLDGSQILIHCIKGFEHTSFKRISTIIREETCCRKLGVLSGPNLAKEILMGHPSATVVASPFEEVVAASQQALISTFFRVYGHRDVVGAEVAGALKNIIALASGMSGGLGFQHNTQSLLLTRGLVEIIRFGLRMGAQTSTFRGLAGMGDLIATCSSDLSRNYQVGARIAKGESLEQVLGSMAYVAEGVPTTRSVWRMSQQLDVEMPIVEGVYRILEGQLSPREAIEGLMTRENRYEEDFGA